MKYDTVNRLVNGLYGSVLIGAIACVATLPIAYSIKPSDAPVIVQQHRTLERSVNSLELVFHDNPSLSLEKQINNLSAKRDSVYNTLEFTEANAQHLQYKKDSRKKWRATYFPAVGLLGLMTICADRIRKKYPKQR